MNPDDGGASEGTSTNNVDIDNTYGASELSGYSDSVPGMVSSPKKSRKNSWFETASLIVIAMVGCGITNVPVAMSDAGWLGITFLLLGAALSNFTANLLGQTMRIMPKVADYSSVGFLAFSIKGRIFCGLTQNISLAGLVISHISMFGLLMSTIKNFNCIGPNIYVIILAILTVPVTLFVSEVRHLRLLAPTAVLALLTVLMTSVGSVVLFRLSDDYGVSRVLFDLSHSYSTENWYTALPYFALAFGTHSMLPTLYAANEHRHHWWKSTNFAYNITLFGLYVPLTIACYSVFGAGTRIRDEHSGVFLFLLDTNNVSVRNLVVSELMLGFLCFYLISAIIVLICPILLRVERLVVKSTMPAHVILEANMTSDVDIAKRIPFHIRLFSRSLIILLFTIFALFIPYASRIMALLTTISMAFDVYIWPALINWNTVTSAQYYYLKRTMLAVVVIIGLLVAVAGILSAVRDLNDAFAKPWVFDYQWHWKCNSNSSSFDYDDV